LDSQIIGLILRLGSAQEMRFSIMAQGNPVKEDAATRLAWRIAGSP
jgi:hypothetical protein